MELKIDQKYPNLRAQTIIDGDIIASNGFKIYRINNNDVSFAGEIPTSLLKSVASKLNLSMRALRLGIFQIKPINDGKVLIFADRDLFLSDKDFSSFENIDLDVRSYQILDHNICSTDNYTYFGEYLPNKERDEVYIYRTSDGFDWERVHEFPENSIKHIHVIQEDPFEDKLWFSTGDNDNESMVGVTDPDFSNIEIIGRGDQKWRTVEFQFTENKVYWAMDSPDTESHLIEYDRSSGEVEKMDCFDGPVYSFKKVGNHYLIATATEGGKAETDDKAHIWISNDLKNWKDTQSFQKDLSIGRLSARWLNLPNVFGHGKIKFSDNMRDRVVFSGMGLKGVDNSLLVGRIE